MAKKKKEIIEKVSEDQAPKVEAVEVEAEKVEAVAVEVKVPVVKEIRYKMKKKGMIIHIRNIEITEDMLSEDVYNYLKKLNLDKHVKTY